MRLKLSIPRNPIRGLDRKEVNKDFTLKELLGIILVGHKGTNRLTLRKSPLKAEVLDGDKLLGSLDDKGNVIVDDSLYSRYKSIRKAKREESNQKMENASEAEFNVENVDLTQEERDEIDNARRGATVDKVKRVFVDKYGDREIRLEGNNSIDKDVFTELIKNTYGRAFNKFGETLARWSLDGTLDDRRPDQKQRFALALDLLVQAHEDEYDENFNGLMPDDIIRTFATEVQEQTAAERAKSESVKEKESEYDIVQIKTKEEAERYYKYVAIDGSSTSGQWCITRGSFNSYVGDFDEGKAELFYFMLKKGVWETYNKVPEPGPTAPYDEFGLSMIAVSIKEDDSLKTATTRWNHTQGGNDNMFTESQLAEFAGRPFRKAFPPITSPEDRERMLIYQGYPLVKSGGKSIVTYKNDLFLTDNKTILKDGFGVPFKFSHYWNITLKNKEGINNRIGYLLTTTDNPKTREFVLLDKDLNKIKTYEAGIKKEEVVNDAKEVLQNGR